MMMFTYDVLYFSCLMLHQCFKAKRDPKWFSEDFKYYYTTLITYYKNDQPGTISPHDHSS
ncbi:hypothetical protein HanRHA438_Chr12g0574001 [Helianthus annuus]|nr:hypothetical protein HanRHA438_Chr12g0574001 [Helianthus annuus]